MDFQESQISHIIDICMKYLSNWKFCLCRCVGSDDGWPSFLHESSRQDFLSEAHDLVFKLRNRIGKVQWFVNPDFFLWYLVRIIICFWGWIVCVVNQASNRCLTIFSPFFIKQHFFITSKGVPIINGRNMAWSWKWHLVCWNENENKRFWFELFLI